MNKNADIGSLTKLVVFFKINIL